MSPYNNFATNTISQIKQCKELATMPISLGEELKHAAMFKNGNCYKTIGVLGYQGGCDLHISALTRLGFNHKKIRYQDDFSNIDGLILPGGESSVQYQYCLKYNLIDKIVDFAKTKKPILGTCAGTILLSKFRSNKVNGLGLIDINIHRNFYGKQICSGIEVSDNGTEIMFIRAPGIIDIGKRVQSIDTFNNHPILVKEDNIYCASFHPEVHKVDQKNIIYKIFNSLSIYS